ncbi:hypothetical protein YY92_08160 [Campylobacter fetus]|uniref:hypothetical protein n=1 Tax=Campylobacter fetus TaxID=196 RepID=UPI0011C9F84A|nr:hypothetical protein [Campylobacter fetus]EAJ1232638.1 hypothetical protein [Campylobacter fetus]EAK0414683.1 hypothetical protein [Campylobacter fetus]TXF09201.1 hypothetical protein FPD25_03445 [Campylobacter fetus subsp. fetus]
MKEKENAQINIADLPAIENILKERKLSQELIVNYQLSDVFKGKDNKLSISEFKKYNELYKLATLEISDEKFLDFCIQVLQERGMNNEDIDTLEVGEVRIFGQKLIIYSLNTDILLKK